MPTPDSAAETTASDDDTQTILITGANRGLGLEMTRLYVDKGWHVIAVCRRSSDDLVTLAESEKVEIYELDLTDDDALAGLADRLGDKTIDVLLNNAGTMGRKSFADLGLKAGCFGSFNREEWHEVLDINLCTPMRLIELLVDNVASSANGRILNVSSMVGSMKLNGAGGLYAYRASKAGVNAITKSLSIDLAPRGVTVAALHPGFVRTEMSGPMAEIEPIDSAMGMVNVIDGITPEQAGMVIAWDGSILPW